MQFILILYIYFVYEPCRVFGNSKTLSHFYKAVFIDSLSLIRHTWIILDGSSANMKATNKFLDDKKKETGIFYFDAININVSKKTCNNEVIISHLISPLP